MKTLEDFERYLIDEERFSPVTVHHTIQKIRYIFDHTPHLPFKYMEDPIVMMNDERTLNAFVEDHPNFSIEDGCKMLSMDAVRLLKAMKRVGLDLDWRNTDD